MSNQQWLIFQKDLLVTLRHTSIKLPDSDVMPALKVHFMREHVLGHFNGEDIFCAELSADAPLDDTFELIPLRKALEHLGADWYPFAVKGYSVINWDRNHQFCGCCGHATVHNQGSFERYCQHCKLHFYPRISPSIIVLIQKDEQLLMARSHYFQPGVYGLIAGFVEAGESIEEAVHRETFEEIGIRINNLRYFGSQPWPFPDSLMVGFFADYESGDLCIDPKEIEDAGWYDYDKLPGRPSTSLSIASKMLDEYLQARINTVK